MKNYWLGIFGQVKALLLRFTRDKASLFFTFLFPLIFLFIFGSIYSNHLISFNVAIINHSNTDFAKEFVKQGKESKESPIKIKDIKDLDEAKEKLKRSEIDGILELPEDFGKIKNHVPNGTIKVLHTKGSEQTGNALSGVITQITNKINKQLGQPEAPLKTETVAIGDQALKAFDYVFTGLLGFALMTMNVFGLSQQIPAEKQKGSYRRLRAAPFTKGQLIFSYSIYYALVSLLSLLVMLIAGSTIFHFNMHGSWLLFAFFTVPSIFLTIGIGLLIGGWSKNEDQASLLCNIIAFPMMFLSGTFFPTYLFPDFLKNITKFIPMTPIVDGFRMIMTENATLFDIKGQLIALFIFLIAIYVIAIKTFRW